MGMEPPILRRPESRRGHGGKRPSDVLLAAREAPHPRAAAAMREFSSDVTKRE